MLIKKYVEIADLVLSDIDTHRWKERLPGIHVLAKYYDVAPATISKAVKILAQRGIVTIQGTRGVFISNKCSVRPKYGVIGEIGLVHRHGDDKELQTIESEAARHKLKVLTIGTSVGLANASPLFYTQLPVDGLIFTNSTLRKPIIELLRHTGTPFVSTNRIYDVEGVDWVDFDVPGIVNEALLKLSRLGHNRIAFIGFKQTITGLYNELKKIHHMFCKENKVSAESLWHETTTTTNFWYLHGENYCQIYGVQSCEALMNQNHPPTAAIILGDSIAEGFCESLLKITKLTLPENFPIITFCITDSQASTRYYGKIVLPSIERHVKAMKILLNKMKSNHVLPPVQILMQMQINT